MYAYVNHREQHMHGDGRLWRCHMFSDDSLTNYEFNVGFSTSFLSYGTVLKLGETDEWIIRDESIYVRFECREWIRYKYSYSPPTVYNENISKFTMIFVYV